jgi:hypothetical protein
MATSTPQVPPARKTDDRTKNEPKETKPLTKISKTNDQKEVKSTNIRMTQKEIVKSLLLSALILGIVLVLYLLWN